MKVNKEKFLERLNFSLYIYKKFEFGMQRNNCFFLEFNIKLFKVSSIELEHLNILKLPVENGAAFSIMHY